MSRSTRSRSGPPSPGPAGWRRGFLTSSARDQPTLGRGGDQSDPDQPLRTSLGPADRTPTTAPCRARTPVRRSGRGGQGDFAKLGGSPQGNRERLGGAQVLIAAAGRARPPRRRILADRRMVRTLEHWTSCMAEAGYRYEDPDEIDGASPSASRRSSAPSPPVRHRSRLRPEPRAVRPRRARRAPARRGRDRARRLRVRAPGHRPVEAVVRPRSRRGSPGRPDADGPVSPVH